jgi:hypothetical protein
MSALKHWLNLMMLTATTCALLAYACVAHAHLSLLQQEQQVQGYNAVFEGSADAPAIYAGYAVNYAMGLYDANHLDVPFDFAYVDFSAKQDGVIVFSGMLPGSTGLMSQTSLNIAMPSAGAYQAEITFMRKEQSVSGVRELAKANFSFDVVKNPSDAPSAWDNKYLWAAIGMLLGGLLWPSAALIPGRLRGRSSD